MPLSDPLGKTLFLRGRLRSGSENTVVEDKYVSAKTLRQKKNALYRGKNLPESSYKSPENHSRFEGLSGSFYHLQLFLPRSLFELVAGIEYIHCTRIARRGNKQALLLHHASKASGLSSCLWPAFRYKSSSAAGGN